MNFRIGDLITFTYPLPPNTRAHDKFPRVLVLHPGWEGLVHGLNFNYLSADEVNTVRMLIDPFYEMKYRDALKRRNPNAYNELESIITSPIGTRNSKMTSPQDFYRGVIRPFIMQRGWDPYRKYRVDKISGARIITSARVITGEDSLAKWQKERQELAAAAKKALEGAQTPEQQKAAKQMEKDLAHATSMSKRKSVLSRFADFVKFWRGPKGPRFGR